MAANAWPELRTVTNGLGALGQMVIKLLRALAVPLVLFAILDAFVKTRITAASGLRLAMICAVNGGVAMVIGLSIMNAFEPGTRWKGQLDAIQAALNPEGPRASKPDDPDAPAPTLDVLPNLDYYVPKSLARPFVYNNVISVVLIAVLAGAALRRVHDRSEGHPEAVAAQAFSRWVDGVYQVLLVMLDWIIRLVPAAVLGVVAQVVGAVGPGVFRVLWVFLVVILAGMLVHALGYYPLAAWLVGRRNPRTYLGQGADAILTAVSMNSSLATVPVTLKCLTERMGVSHASARLAACVGTNLNNDGIALYEAMAALFLLQATGADPGMGKQLVIVLASLMAAAGVAGIPEAGLIVLPLVLSAAGLSEPLISLAIPLIVPVDWILARARSGVNVMNDMLVAILLDRTAGERREA
jgi:DAACS family dicarboxylate/amino acid:cation (Na+ or H+) symporter